MSNLKKLLADSRIRFNLESRTRRPVSISLSLTDMHNYMSRETDHHVIAEWCRAYLKRYNQLL